MTVVMYDNVNVELLPPGAEYYAGYINGKYVNADAIKHKYPASTVIRISITAYAHDGACLDIENGDATNAETPMWFRNRIGHTLTPRPWFYTSASNVSALVETMKNAGISRDKYYIWSAHYTGHAHICAPDTCGYPVADGTQWTNYEDKRSLDESLMREYMMPHKPVAPPVKPPVVTPPQHPVIDDARDDLNQAIKNNPTPGPIRRALLAALNALKGIRR